MKVALFFRGAAKPNIFCHDTSEYLIEKAEEKALTAVAANKEKPGSDSIKSHINLWP